MLGFCFHCATASWRIFIVIGGMKKLGLDPKNIKYLLVSHAHGDHIGGAEMLQSRYGIRVVMGGLDWDVVEKYPNGYQEQNACRPR